MNTFPILSEQAIIALTVALAHLALLGYIVVKNDPKRTLNYLLLGYLALALGWNLLIFVQQSRILSSEWKVTFMYPLVPLALLLWFYTNTFLQRATFKLWSVLINVLILAIFIAAKFTPRDVIPITLPKGDLPLSRYEFIFWGTAITLTIYAVASILSAVSVQKTMYSPRHRNRLQFLQLALLLTIIGIGLYLTQITLARQLGLIIHWLGSFVLVYVHTNQNLPDIKSSMKELVSLLILTALTLIAYTITIYYLELAFAGQVNAYLKIAVSAAVLLTLLYPPLRRLVQHYIERMLFRNQHNYAQIIKTYVQTINNILFMRNLVTVSLTFIREHLNVSRGAFLLLRGQDETHYHFAILSNLNGDLPTEISLRKNTPLTNELIDHKQSTSQYYLDVMPHFSQTDQEGVAALQAMAFEQFFPITRNNDLIAILAVGPFESGQPYFLQDIELLSTIADQSAIALENARLFEDVRYNLEEITQMNDLMDNIFSSIESGVITIDNQDRITIVNKAARRILNLSPDIKLENERIAPIIGQFSNTPLPALLRDVKSTQRSYHAFELTQNIPHRGLINLSVDLTPIKDTQKQMKGIAIVINDLTENRRLQVVQNLFRKYLSPAVVDRLPDDPDQLKLGGHRQEVTILFADIRGFTTFSEHQDPENLINVLNRYLSMAAESILVYEGTLDKFMGDAVMAIFNAPLSQPDHTIRAVKAAAAMQRAIAHSHRKMGKYAPQLNFGVGIHVGEAVIGNVGTQARMDYTAIGDAVNLAKRIQENTPGGRVLLSTNAYERVKNQIRGIPYKKLTLKGRETPEQTYELLNIL